MLVHHTLDCAKSRLNPEGHWLVNGSFLLTESFCKNHLFSVTSLWCTFVNPCLVVHPTHILVGCTLGCTVYTGWIALL